MTKLLRMIEAAMRDARRAEALWSDARTRRALRSDPEGALLRFELRAGATLDDAAARQARTERRDRRVRAARRGAGYRVAARLRGRRSRIGSSSSSSHSRAP